MKELYSSFESGSLGNVMKPGETVDREMLFHFKENAGNRQKNLIQMNEVADIIGKQAIYDTIYKPNDASPWIYMGQCYTGQTENRQVAIMPIVYICSRYRADTKEELRQNIEVAKWAAEQAARKGQIPIAPHLYFPRFMDDSIPQDRYFGMGAGKRLMEQCSTFHIVTVDGIISDGMREEIDYMTGTLMLTGTKTNFTKIVLDTMLTNRMEN
jgi:hypothetical protein